MIPLPIEYRKNGFIFKLVQRSAEVAIYKQIDPELLDFEAYEVFEVQKNETFERWGKIFPAHESVPGSERWGKDAFTVRSILAAEEKAAILQKRVDDRKNRATAPPTNENSLTQ